MSKIKVFLVHDDLGSDVANFDPDIFPEGVEALGSIRMRKSGLDIGSPCGEQRAPDKNGSNCILNRENDRLNEGAFHQELQRGASALTIPRKIGNRSIYLTRTEAQVLRFLAKGYQNKEIANEMYISINTVKSHVSSIFRKLRVKNRAQAVRYAYKSGFEE